MKRTRAGARERVLRLDDAIELMRVDGHRLMLMHCTGNRPGAPAGMAYYVVPGGYVDAVDAQKIIERPDVRPNEDGLFPGCTQTWRMGG